MSELKLGKGQMRILQVLWEKKRATAQEITDAINKIEPIKHSSVQTFLRILERKNAVAHDVEGRTFIYYPLMKDRKVKTHVLRDFINNVFAGSPESMISYMIKNIDISPEQLQKIKELLEEKEK